MIRQVTTPLQKGEFLDRLQGALCLEPMMGTALELFWQKPGLGGQFFLGDRGALMTQGALAAAVGGFDGEELDSFLTFVGVTNLLTPGPAPEGWAKASPMLAFQGGRQLALPQPSGITLDRDPPLMAAAALALEGEGREQAENLYVQSCIRKNHGYGLVWGARAGEELVSVISVNAFWGPWAYLAQGCTRPQYRGQAIGGWLISSLICQLASQGYTPCLLCRPERQQFYRRLGMTQTAEYNLYKKKE